MFTLLSVAGLRAQEYKIAVENNKDARLTLDAFTGELPIEGYNGNEIIITGSLIETPERAKGLKPVYGGGQDNTNGLGINVEKDGNKITLHCLLGQFRAGNYHIKVPESMALKIGRDCGGGGGHTIVSNMKSEVEFKGCDHITLKNVTGPLVVSTINGGVNVVFSEISKDKPISLASINGDVDVTLPAKAAVDLEMSTMSGGMFTDFDLPADNKEMKRVGGSKIKSQLNGGGTELKLHNINGNIYLRKA